MAEQMRTIQVDLDVHKKIEAARQRFAETSNDVLRRLLGCAEKPVPQSSHESEQSAFSNEGRAWHDFKVSLPHGTQLKMRFYGKIHEGVIDNGCWLVDGNRYNSPSGAAGYIAEANGGQRYINGRRYWQVKRPGDEDWTTLSRLSDK